MKLCNFLRLDPSYSGKGLSAGSKLDEAVWNEFAGDRKRLERVASAIRLNAPLLKPPTVEDDADEDFEAAEGQVLTRTHRARERNRTLIEKKKAVVLKARGRLECEVCGFDSEAKYGPIGKDFAECHHQIPLSDLKPGAKTRLVDLAIVCANCHRMIHRARPWLTIAQLQETLKP
jgi:5-methylcytosine-specific restriction protein A